MSLPSPGVLLRVAQVALSNDQPIYLDYYADSLEKKCCIGVREDNSKFLAKSDVEYTSHIQSMSKCEDCFIISTENSIYLVATCIPVKKVLASTTTE
jgi:hypothetical protein